MDVPIGLRLPLCDVVLLHHCESRSAVAGIDDPAEMTRDIDQ